jgi:putative heme iron utilization protein
MLRFKDSRYEGAVVTSKQFAHLLGVVLAVALVAPVAASAAEPAAQSLPALCVSAEQRTAVQSKVAAGGRWSVAALATETGLSEAQVMAGLPAERRVGIAGDAFHAVWAQLVGWNDAVFIVRKAGHVFEIHGKVHPGEPSKVSKYFNLDDHGPGVTGHLRPDLVAAIYAAELPGREGPERGLLFFDRDGQLAFEVYVPATEQDPKAGVLAQFLATRAALQALPAPHCPD